MPPTTARHGRCWPSAATPRGAVWIRPWPPPRADVFWDMESAVPDRRLVEIFQLKYDYHNAKTLLKAAAMGGTPSPCCWPADDMTPPELAEGWRREELRGCSPAFQKAMTQAKALLEDSHDPQQADLILDRACFEEMAQLARGPGQPLFAAVCPAAGGRGQSAHRRAGPPHGPGAGVFAPGAAARRQRVRAEHRRRPGGEPGRPVPHPAGWPRPPSWEPKLAHPGAGSHDRL